MGKLKVGDKCTGYCYDGTERDCAGIVIVKQGNLYCDCECNHGSTLQTPSDITTQIKQNIQTTDYIYLQNTVSNKTSKIAAENFFPSINVVGKGSESIWISPLLQKNQINLKGIKSADANKVTVTTTDNNITVGLNETGIDLNECNNSTSEFLSSAYLGPITASILTTDVTGSLPVANGGTALTTIAKGSVLYASATDTLASASIITNGQLLVGHTANGYPIPGYITSLDSSVTVNNYAGSIDLSVTSLAQLTSDIDMGIKNINMNETAGNSWLSGDGTNEGLLITTTGKVFIGDSLPTKPTVGGQLHIGGDSTAAIVIGNTNNYKDHTISMETAPSATNAKDLSINGAAASSGNTTGGKVTVASGASQGSGNAGDIAITAAAAPGAGTGGDITLTAGDSTSGDPGSVLLKGYDASGGTLTTIATADVDAGVTLGTSLAFATSGTVHHRGTALGGHVFYQGAPATTDDGTTAISAANIATGLVTCTPTGDRTKALDTAANIVSGLGLSTDGDSFDFTIINLAGDGTALDIALSGGTGITYVGNVHISAFESTDQAIASGSAQFRLRRTGATAVTCYRLS